MAKPKTRPKRILRVKFRSKKWRLLFRHYGRPITHLVRQWISEGLSVAECAERIEHESEIPMAPSVLYKWLADEMDAGQPLHQEAALLRP